MKIETGKKYACSFHSADDGTGFNLAFRAQTDASDDRIILQTTMLGMELSRKTYTAGEIEALNKVTGEYLRLRKDA